MATISKEEYDFFKSQNPSDLTSEEREWIREYESAEAGAPSQEDLEWAAFSMNEKDPGMQKINRESGDTKRAEDIINQSRTAKELMIKQGKDPYVRPVSEVPDDVAEGYGFKFNWKDAYEKENGTPLRATEADAQKLKKYIDSKMYEVDDPVKLQQVAYNMHLWNPNTSSWSEFIQSEQGDRFREYLGDIQKYQKGKAVDEIWNDSPADVDFMLPVTKEYAKKNYENINGLGDVALPLAFDVGANLAMTGAGSGLKFMKARPTIAGIYGNFAAPVITEAGNMAANDKPLPEAAVGAIEGGLVNAGTPVFLNKMGTQAGRFGSVSSAYGPKATEAMNRIANTTSKVERMKKSGSVWKDGKEWKGLVNGKEEVLAGQELKQRTKNHGVIPSDEIALSKGGSGAFKFAIKDEAAQKRIAKSEESNKYLKTVIEKLDRGEQPTLAELEKSGLAQSESFMNYLGRNLENVPALKTYLTNAAGRPKFGQRGLGTALNTMLPSVGLFKQDKEDLNSDRWYRYYGLK